MISIKSNHALVNITRLVFFACSLIHNKSWGKGEAATFKKGLKRHRNVSNYFSLAQANTPQHKIFCHSRISLSLEHVLKQVKK